MRDYTRWADKRMMHLVENLTDEEFERDVHSMGGSMRKRYVHLAKDTWEWYHDWMGLQPSSEPNFGAMKREDLHEWIREYQNRFYGLIETRIVENRKIPTANGTVTISLEEILFHLTNHATYHRGQMALGLRILGRDVWMTDYVPFLRDTHEHGT